MLLERRPPRGGLQLLEAVDELERVGVEDRELLLHREGEVAPVLERLARNADELLVREPLLVAHWGHYSS